MANSPFDRSTHMVEPLTHREREILSRLAGDLYNREIAEALTLAPSSIKWYTRQIYAKLGVNSRQAAIRRARELGLLDFKTGPIFHSHTLPAALTPFVGRQSELEQVRHLLADPDYRLLTLTGAGGVGKTRLALRAASELQGNYPQGAWLVELASLSDPELVPQTVAAALDLHPEGGHFILSVLVDHLHTRNLLLVLDNCEHLVAACASLANSLLQACPDLHILATSREALGVEGERTYLVPSLSFPEAEEKILLEELIKFEAVDLFIHRAKAALPDFELNLENAEAVRQICQRLDGIPLALELAAVRLRVMDVEQIASQLDDRFSLLTGGDRTALPHLKTMRTSIDWSYQLLSEPEKELLGRLSVFAGGWTLAASRAVCADDLLPETDILDQLEGLVNKSLVHVIRRKGRELRYRMLETVRQYATEKFSEKDDVKVLHERHLVYFISLAEQVAPDLEGANSVLWLRRLEDEIDNLRLALGWSLEHNVEAGLWLASTVGEFWYEQGRGRELYDQISRLLDRPEAQAYPRARAHALGIKSKLLSDHLGDPVQAQACAEMSLALSREIGDREEEAYSLYRLGYSASMQGDTFLARKFLEESLTLYRVLGNKVRQADALAHLSVTSSGDGERDRCLAEESLALCREAGDQIRVSRRLFTSAIVACEYGDFTAARRWIEEAVSIERQLNLRGDLPESLDAYGRVEFRQGNYEQARAYFEEGIALNDEIGRSGEGLWTRVDLAYLHLRQGELASARIAFVDSLSRFQNSGNKSGMTWVLEGLASLAVAECRWKVSARLFSWADSMRLITGDHRPATEQVDEDRDLATIRLHLDEATLQAAEAAGRAMTLEEAIAFARNN